MQFDDRNFASNVDVTLMFHCLPAFPGRRQEIETAIPNMEALASVPQQCGDRVSGVVCSCQRHTD